jgi:hypothetical protein
MEEKEEAREEVEEVKEEVKEMTEVDVVMRKKWMVDVDVQVIKMDEEREEVRKEVRKEVRNIKHFITRNKL